MRPLRDIADRIMAENKHKLKTEEWEPIYSLDGPSIHVRALDNLDFVFEGQNKFPLPPHSADIHKVIEHVHANLSTAMDKWAVREGRGKSAEEFREHYKSLFYKLSASAIQKDILSLPDTLRIIKTPVNRGGTGGKRAPRPYN